MEKPESAQRDIESDFQDQERKVKNRRPRLMLYAASRALLFFDNIK